MMCDDGPYDDGTYEAFRCKACDGTGQVTDPDDFMMSGWLECPHCDGMGEV